ncbi:MAG: AAA family ATPase [Myxococcales bacterium]|nr:AAA family ATPase [Polyangiaceae bacterium]MDW8247675.1 AAA family ATPase [Myxococcales bacterium]
MSSALQPGEVQAARERLDALRAEISRVFIGSPRITELMLVALLARGHVLLEGVPGVAKTTLVKAFAIGLGCTVRRIQFTPDLLPADITGTYVLSPKEGAFTLRPGPVFANVVLADEINRAPAKTQAALLEAMQERQTTIDGDRFELPNPFLVLATQNPVDLEGTYPLPEAQIDRFLVRVLVGYPAAKEEVAMLRTHNASPPEMRRVLSGEEVLALQAIAARVHVEDDLLEYAAALAAFTRSHPHVVLGVSPRGTLGLVQAAKAMAILQGRTYVSPDDFQTLAPSVFAHRLVMVPEVEADPKGREAVIAESLQRIGYRRAVRVV